MPSTPSKFVAPESSEEKRGPIRRDLLASGPALWGPVVSARPLRAGRGSGGARPSLQTRRTLWRGLYKREKQRTIDPNLVIGVVGRALLWHSGSRFTADDVVPESAAIRMPGLILRYCMTSCIPLPSASPLDRYLFQRSIPNGVDPRLLWPDRYAQTNPLRNLKNPEVNCSGVSREKNE
jgi:hypothetical protein